MVRRSILFKIQIQKDQGRRRWYILPNGMPASVLVLKRGNESVMLRLYVFLCAVAESTSRLWAHCSPKSRMFISTGVISGSLQISLPMEKQLYIPIPFHMLLTFRNGSMVPDMAAWRRKHGHFLSRSSCVQRHQTTRLKAPSLAKQEFTEYHRPTSL